MAVAVYLAPNLSMFAISLTMQLIVWHHTPLLRGLKDSYLHGLVEDEVLKDKLWDPIVWKVLIEGALHLFSEKL
ncbi:hypothetical protein O6P43_026083 [Quillaja saponaria]|uniref:Uncharacterized protein n=1 Tax=Quillaja saponaria TaxID=32244 RepID=A0AAD7LBS1_QUISA|nr:hypothetical protein O6P43_026083 [Quillaja saponaria]